MALLNIDRTNWPSIALCFVIAIIFWMFNALNKDYITNLDFPIRFQFDREKYTPAIPLPEEVAMQVEGRGWNILKRSFNIGSKELLISLNKPTQVKKIVGSTLPAMLTDQLEDLRIKHVITDTLNIHIAPWQTRTLRVVTDSASFTFAEGYNRLGPIVIKPAKIEVKGAKSKVDTLPDRIFIRMEASDLDSDFKERINVTTFDRQELIYTPSTVTVSFRVAAWKKVNVKIKLVLLNVPPGMETETIQDSIQCSIELPEGEAETLLDAAGLPNAFIDMKLWKNKEQKMKPKVMGLPEYARLIHVDSVTLQ